MLIPPELTPLHLAARDGNDEATASLLATDESLIDALDVGQWTALHYAAQRGHNKIVSQLLARRPKLAEAVSRGGWTALHCASQGGDEATVQLILDVLLSNTSCSSAPEVAPRKNAALIATATNLGWTALHFAAQAGNDKVATQLLLHSPKMIHAVNSSGRSALHCALNYGHSKVVELLLALAPDMAYERDSAGNTLLHYVFGLGRGKHFFSESLMAQAVRMYPEAVFTANNDHQTPFDVAVRSGNLWGIELLQWKFSVDDILISYANTKRLCTIRIRTLETQCVPLLVWLRTGDVMEIVYDYLGYVRDIARNNKKKSEEGTVIWRREEEDEEEEVREIKKGKWS